MIGGRNWNKHCKLKLPVFLGEELTGWLFREERYFSVKGMGDAERLEADAICFEGKALSWFAWMEA